MSLVLGDLAGSRRGNHWVNLQARYDLDVAHDSARQGVRRIERLAA